MATMKTNLLGTALGGAIISLSINAWSTPTHFTQWAGSPCATSVSAEGGGAYVWITGCTNSGAGHDIWKSNGTTWTANHTRHGSGFPDGGNALTVDGSASWIKVEKMYQVTTYDTAGHQWYFYQNDLSTIPAAQLTALQFKP